MKRASFITILALLVFGAGPVFAGASFSGTRGLIRTKSADTIGRGMLNFQVTGHYYLYPDSPLTEPFFGDGITTPATVDYHMFITRGTLTYGLSDNLEIAASLDVRNWMRSPKQKNGHTLDTFTRGGIGDTYVAAKVNVPLPGSSFELGAYGEASFATGSKSRGFTTNNTDFVIMGLGTADLTELEKFVPTRIHLNAGYRINRNEETGYGIFLPEHPDSSGFLPPAYPATPTGESNSFNDQFVFNTAIEFPAPQVTFFVEFDWQQYMNVDPLPANVSKNLLTLTPGLMYASPGGFEITVAGDINLNSGDTPSLAGPPDWGLWLMLGGTGAVIPQDTDEDGIPDNVDQCPDQPEDLDGFYDDDGCPDLDNDNDGIPDAQDSCPDLPEDADGFQDEDGCPDLDNDQDGIPDSEDRCPNEPEDFDGDMDQDGCPDLVKDSDNDGIADDVDRCPLQAEDVDGFQDDDGCPDLDNDLDGIPDTEDQCPNSPETFNGFQDADGCPDERPIAQQFVLKGVTFESGSAALTPDSYRVLDEVVRSLMAYPEVRVEIQGYTDSSGKASFNQQLSQKRAEAVQQYLVNAGVDPTRLAAIGFGEENPVASNSTPGGRAQNRRIEFKRLN